MNSYYHDGEDDCEGGVTVEDPHGTAGAVDNSDEDEGADLGLRQEEEDEEEDNDEEDAHLEHQRDTVVEDEWAAGPPTGNDYLYHADQLRQAGQLATTWPNGENDVVESESDDGQDVEGDEIEQDLPPRLDALALEDDGEEEEEDEDGDHVLDEGENEVTE